jgi:hypothetical protein
MRGIFLGKPLHWALWIVIAAILYPAGKLHMHVRWFGWFSTLLLLIGAAVVLIVLTTSRPGEPITREPFEDT